MPDEIVSASALGQLVRALRDARIRRDLSVDEIGRLVKIRSVHIDKLEEGDFTFLPPLYLFSCLCQYARELGVGSDLLLEECRRELGIADTRFSMHPFPEPDAQDPNGSGHGSSLKRGKWLMLTGTLLVVALLGVAVLFFFGGV
jgi:cytoskeletal protein RodZ